MSFNESLSKAFGERRRRKEEKLEAEPSRLEAERIKKEQDKSAEEAFLAFASEQVLPVLKDLKAYLGTGKITESVESGGHYRAEIVWDQVSGHYSYFEEIIEIYVDKNTKSLNLIAGHKYAIGAPYERPKPSKGWFKRIRAVQVVYGEKPKNVNRLYLDEPELRTAIKEFIVWAIKENLTNHEYVDISMTY